MKKYYLALFFVTLCTIDRLLQGDTRNFTKIPLDRLSETDYKKLNFNSKDDIDKQNTEVIFVKNGTYSIHTKIVLASGKCTFPTKKWNSIKLSFKGKQISAYLNGKQLCSIEDATYSSGLTGFGCGWHTADFDNLSID